MTLKENTMILIMKMDFLQQKSDDGFEQKPIKLRFAEKQAISNEILISESLRLCVENIMIT